MPRIAASSYSDLRTVEAAILGKQQGYVTFDVSSGFARDSWSISAFIVNLTDERASTSRFVQCAEAVCADKVYVIPNKPRTFGVKFGQKF